MASRKEALILLIDVGPSMHNLLPEIEKVCSMLVQKKLIYTKYDEVGVVLFGTEETENALTNEVGGYEHVVVLKQFRVVDGDLIDALQRLPRGTVRGDFITLLLHMEMRRTSAVLDAIVVGMDVMIKKFGQTIKGKKRLCLITNALDPIKDPYEGTKADQVDTIAAQMNAHGMKLDSVIVRGNLTGDADKGIMDENDLLLSRFSEKACATTVHVESPTSLLGALRTRNISPTTIFRGDLEISPNLKIKVWVYKKTSEEKFPTLKKYSENAPPTDKLATHEVKVDYEYKRVEDPTTVVPPEQRIKGYRYGPQVVPISTDELEAVKFKPEKSVKLLGFTNVSNIMRHYYMKDVNIFVAEPNNSKATVAVSAFARAMKEMNKVAILRCVWRQGQGSVVVGALTPNISNSVNIPDSFYFNVLPFAEDVREFQFPSFNNFHSSLQPNEQQQKAADNLVMMLDLAPPGKEEALLPDFTPNPVLERFYRLLELKSKKPDAYVPPLDKTLKRITEPDPELLSHNQLVVDEVCKQFELKENPKIKKSSRRLWRETPFGSNEVMAVEDVIDNQAVLSIKNESSSQVDRVGKLTPVQDFEAMMARRDSLEWVNKAINDMKNVTFDLVENSYEGDTFQKALDCLLALRKGCILEQEPKQFNDFLRQLLDFCSKKYLSSFCNFLASKQMMLITKTEAVDSDVTDDETRSFNGLLIKTEPVLF